MLISFKLRPFWMLLQFCCIFRIENLMDLASVVYN